MGIGDEIMASGHARHVHRITGKRVKIVDVRGRTRWHDVWQGLRYIVPPGESASDAIRIKNGPRCRPYIKYPFNRRTGCTFSGWRAQDYVGEINLTGPECAKATSTQKKLGPFVLVEPNVPKYSNPNKQWGWDNWQALADVLGSGGIQGAQFRLKDLPMLKGVTPIDTDSFREGAALLSLADGLVLPEGGLHHAAGVLRVPAVVLFGGAVPVRATGYPWHTNIADQGEACGRWMRCQHCDAIWEGLAPNDVALAFLSKLIPAQV